MSIEVRPVTLPGEAARFVKSWWSIYEDDPHWVPPLIFERKAFLNPSKNPYFKVAEVQCFMAFKDGKAVGTIAATVDKMLLEHNPKTGMFGFFEFIDDIEVARGLYDAACTWLRGRGMERVWGPYNLSPNHEFGLLVDGFDTDPAIANPHNRPYYQRIYEELGMHKVMDWYAYWLSYASEPPPRIQRLVGFFERRYPNVEIRRARLENFDEEVVNFWEIYNDAWEDNWGHTRFTRDEFMWAAKNLKDILDERFVLWAYVDGKLAAGAITLLDYNQVAKKMNGRIFPFGWYHFLFGKKNISQLRVWVLGVKKEFQRMPLGAPLYAKIWEEGAKMNITGAECSLILENNHRMRGALEKMGATIYKTYRSYEGLLVDGIPRSNPLADDEASASE